MIGIDIVDISRIEKLLERDQFLTRMFSVSEIKYLEERNLNHSTIAGMIAAKEAVAKAFGVGISKDLVFKEIEILHDCKGAPYVNIWGDQIRNLMEKGRYTGVDINISHDGNYAIGVAKLKTDKNTTRFDKKDFNIGFLKRDSKSNKYDFGKVLIIGGKRGMIGSVLLAGRAALRSGAGLVYYLVPETIRGVIENKANEEIVLSLNDDGKEEFGSFNKEDLLNIISDMDTIAIGTGLGRGESAKKILEIVINNFDGPIVVDADAIDILAENPDMVIDDLYLTPHDMEFSRLSGFNLNIIDYDRLESVQSYIDRHHVNLLLKGNQSIIADSDQFFINPSGNPGMATAGSGDVLTGILGALLARKDSFDMFKLGVFVHGLAGDLAASKYGVTSLIASDIIEFLPLAFGELNDD